MPQSILITIYNSIILPHNITYCNIVWGHTFKTHLNKLCILQKKAIRIICNAPFNSHTRLLFSQTNILPLKDLITLNSLVFMFKLHAKILPPLFADIFVLNSTIHTYNTRQRNLIHVPRVRTSVASNSFKTNFPKLWNKLPNEIKNSSTLSRFRKLSKQMITSF